MPYKEKVKNRGVQETLALGDTMDGNRINIVSEHHGGAEVAEYHPPQMAESRVESLSWQFSHLPPF